MIDLASAIKILEVKHIIPFTTEELKQAYRRAAKRSHPDTKGSNEAFIKVNESYELLKDYVGIAIAIPTTPIYTQPPTPTYSPRRTKKKRTTEEKIQRRITRARNQFRLSWKNAFECAYSESLKGTNLKYIGKKLDDWIISNIPEYFEANWFSSALFTGNAGKAKKEKYRLFLILVAPCDNWNDKFEWAQRYFFLEFGHKFIV